MESGQRVAFYQPSSRRDGDVRVHHAWEWTAPDQRAGLGVKRVEVVVVAAHLEDAVGKRWLRAERPAARNPPRKFCGQFYESCCGCCVAIVSMLRQTEDSR